MIITPIVLTEIVGEATVREPRYIIERANWPLFTAMSSMMRRRKDRMKIDEMVDLFIETVVQATEVAIPMTV